MLYYVFRLINLKFPELCMNNNFEFETQNYTILIFVFINISMYTIKFVLIINYK